MHAIESISYTILYTDQVSFYYVNFCVLNLNYLFFQKQLKYKVAQSRDSKEYYRIYQQWRTASNVGETDGLEPAEFQTFEEELPRYINNI